MTPEQKKIYEFVTGMEFPPDDEIVARVKTTFLCHVMAHGGIDEKGRLTYDRKGTRREEDRYLPYFLFGDVPFLAELTKEE